MSGDDLSGRKSTVTLHVVASLDGFIASLTGLAQAAKAGDVGRFTQAPRFAPRRRLDETKAAREPKLRWHPPALHQEAAE